MPEPTPAPAEDEMAASLRRDGFGDDEIADILSPSIEQPAASRAVEERVARHLAAKHWLHQEDRVWQRLANIPDDYLDIAREVIALVQADADVSSAPADRGAILREAADAVAADTEFHIRYGSAPDYANRYADLLRRMADEAQQPETRQSCACGQDGCEYCDVDEADEEQPESGACTCADAGDCFAPAGHYAQCPQAAVSQPGKEA